MKKQELVGEWFLPDSDLKLSGKLIIDSDKRKIELVLYGTHYIEGLRIDLADHDNHSEYAHEIILGRTHFENLTVISCRWTQTKPLGPDFYEVRFKGSLVLHRVHISKIDDLRISKALLKFPYLSSWYDGSTSPFKLDYKQESVPKSTTKLIEVTEQLKFNFIDSFPKRPLKFGFSYQVDYEKLIEFQYTNSTNFDSILKDSVRFSKLLEFSIRKKVRYKVFSITVDSSCLTKNDHKGEATGLTYVSITYFESYTKSELIDEHDIHQNFMLTSAWVMSQNRLDQVIQKWYSNEGHFHIYDYYLDSHNWFEGTGAVLTNVMFNNRFLNLIQALESYHKRLDLTYTQNVNEYNIQRSKVIELLNCDSNLSEWFTANIKTAPKNFNLRERLQDLLQRLDTIVKPLFGMDSYFSSFPKKAEEYRHKLSHGDIEGVDLGRPLVKLFYEAQFILTLLILETLDFNDMEILRLIKHNQNFIRDINEIVLNHKQQ